LRDSEAYALHGLTSLFERLEPWHLRSLAGSALIPAGGPDPIPWTGTVASSDIIRTVQFVTLVLPFVILIGLLAWHLRRNPLPHSISEPWSRTGQRGWRVAAVVLWSLGMVTILMYAYLWSDYQQTKPRIALPTIGRVYPEYVRGATVYLTQAEQTRLNVCSAASFIFILAALVVSFVVDRQQDDGRYTRPK
jgi:TRAP-type uncharacterized transport system fused permease subunit